MSFISYAQNFEDVMLWRALKSIDNGFYIDIGAQDPVVDSVSLAFYEHGWRGIHIEPTIQYSKKLRAARPDEYVEQVAIGDAQEALTFYEFADTGLSTADVKIAKRHQDAGFFAVQSKVAVVSLHSILEKYNAQAIHWLKIDVEGMEQSVLESWHTSTIRPWILIVESTRPLTQQENYSDWEYIVLGKGYVFVYFDGLNRFYVHQDHHALAQFFMVPPNIFDGFVLGGRASHPFYQLAASDAQQAEAKAQQAEAKAQQAEAKAQQEEVRRQRAEVELMNALAQLDDIQASASWRFTAPMRFGGGLLIRLGSILRNGTNYVIHRSVEACQKPISWLMAAVLRRPQLSRCINKFLMRYPALSQQLLDVARRQGVVAGAPHYSGPTTPNSKNRDPILENMTPRARRIYANLKLEIENKKRKN